MLVSWNWLNDYVSLTMSHDELVDRLTMSGLNHESSQKVGQDYCIDLEVTSNRPDCLGHLGIAREIATLFRLPLNLPVPQLVEVDEPVAAALQVRLEAPDLCSRYTARVIRGVKVGPSPNWLRDRLATIGIASINNVVDVTNYVMFECGQPLHAFDMRHLQGHQIVVRRPQPGETIVAIDHRLYQLEGDDCVIADQSRAVAIGGVMGGADSEINEQTTDVVIESAAFAPLAIRNTARRLNLHSPSSFRFERNVDWHQVDWASRRCCQWILELAGGQLLAGVLDVGTPPPARPPIRFRTFRVKQVLGIEIPTDTQRDILARLGLKIDSENRDAWIVSPPSWRPDVEREIDLIEEIGRVYGYHHIPDDVPVPLATSGKTNAHRVLERVRRVVAAAGFDEAMTASMVPEAWSEAFSPWTSEPPLQSHQPMLGVLDKASQNIGAVNCLRRSMIPSLLEARRINEYRFNDDIELFETAYCYLPQPGSLPRELLMLGLVSERDFLAVKGTVESIVREINPGLTLAFVPCQPNPILDPLQSSAIQADGELFGFIGTLHAAGRKRFGLRRPATIAELNLTWLASKAVLIPRYQPLSEFPAVSRDFNFIVAESVTWADLASHVTRAAGSDFESIRYRETFRDANRDGVGRKRLLLTVRWRSHRDTLTGEQIDEAARRIVETCRGQLDAQLVG